jgi:hypothetical protein
MRRLVAPLAVAAMSAATLAGGLVVGSAATLGLADTMLSAGSTSVSSCDPDGIDVRYQLGWRDRATIERVTIAGIDEACLGLSVTVVMIVAGDPIELGPARISRDGHRRVVVRLDVPGVVPALDVERVHVAIA